MNQDSSNWMLRADAAINNFFASLSTSSAPIDYLANIANSLEWTNVWLFWIVVILALKDFKGK